MTSIDYGDPKTAIAFAARYAKWKHIDSEHGSLTLRAGNRVYSYRTGDSEVSKMYVSAIELAQSPSPKLQFEDMNKLTALTLAGAPGAGIATALVQMAKPRAALAMAKEEHQTLLIVAAVATLGGAVAGYYLGHRSEPDYDNEVFQKTLADTELWRTLEKDWRDAYSEEIKRKGPHNRDGRLLTLDMGELWVEPVVPPKEKSYLEKVFDLHPEIREQADFDWLYTNP